MKKTYLVAPGVTEINGAPVPTNRRVSLTEAEARWDLAHGRLEPVAPRQQTRKKATGNERG